MEVKCYLKKCASYKGGYCSLSEIELDENGCENYIRYMAAQRKELQELKDMLSN